MQISVEIQGAKELQQAIKNVQVGSIKHAVDALNITADAARNKLLDKTKEQKAIDTGTLRDSWHVKKATVQTLTAQVGTQLVPHYAPDIEYGTKPHWPPKEAIKKWARRKLHDEKAWFPIARKIARKGTKARPIFRPTVEEVPAVLERALKTAAKAIERDWAK